MKHQKRNKSTVDSTLFQKQGEQLDDKGLLRCGEKSHDPIVAVKKSY